MFFRIIAISAILLSSGCGGLTIKEDPTNAVVPRGTMTVVHRCFDEQQIPFIESLNLSTFDSTGCDYAGYYCPGVGVSVARQHVGTLEFETTLVHEILHAMHFHGLVDKEQFADALERLRNDKDYPNFVSEVRSTGFRAFIYFVFEQSEYFARVGEEIIKRRGVNVPAYLWPAFRGILHPRFEENGSIYAHAPFPEKAGVELDNVVVEQRSLLQHALGMPSVYDRELPRSDATLFVVDLALDEANRIPLNGTIIFRRRSTKASITTCSSACVVGAQGGRIRCVWNRQQAREVMTAWLDADLSIETFDPTLAFHGR